MSARSAFTLEEFEALLPAIYTMDEAAKHEITSFTRDHCLSRAGFMQLLIMVAEMCASLCRAISERDGVPVDFVELQTSPAASPKAVAFGQVIAVTMNGDAEMQVALLRAMLDRAEANDDGDEIGYVLAHSFGLFSFLMHQLADA